jgi:hypothetical protein
MSKKRIFIQNGPKGYLKVVDEPGRRNESMICLCHGHLWLKDKDKSSRYLIGEIKDSGENVRENNSFSKLSKNEKPCVSGTGYLGKLSFPAAENKQKHSPEITQPAKKFLKRYFLVSEID